MWIGLPEGLPALSPAAATPATAAVLQEGGDDLAAPTPCVSPDHTVDTTGGVIASPLVVAPAASINTSAVVPAPCVAAPVASPGTTEIIVASAGLPEHRPLAPITTTPLGVAAAVPIDTSSVMPASCSVECAAQSAIASGGMVPASSSLPSTAIVEELAVPTLFKHEQDTSFEISGVAMVELLQDGVSQLAVEPVALHCSSSSYASPATIATKNVISTELAQDNDDGEHGASLTVAPVLNSEFGMPVGISTLSTTEVGVVMPAAMVCIPWEFSRPWLEPVPPRPTDLWGFFLGAWSGSRLEAKASITVQTAVQTVLLCNNAEELPMFVMCDKVSQQEEIQQQPWPPPELEEENQRAPCIGEVILDATPYGPDYFRWEIAWVSVLSSCARTETGKRKLTMSDSVSSVDKWWLQCNRNCFEFPWWKIAWSRCYEIANTEIRASSIPNMGAAIPVEGRTSLAKICVMELGGSASAIESMPFTEALRHLPFSLVLKALQHSSVACSLKRVVQWFAVSDIDDAATAGTPGAKALEIKGAPDLVSYLPVHHFQDSLLHWVHRYMLSLFYGKIGWEVDGKCSEYFQWHVAWALCIFVASTESQYYLGVHYSHSNVFEGCLSACYTMTVLHLSWNYGCLNCFLWYAALHYITALLVQSCTVIYDNQCTAGEIISDAFLKYKHCICGTGVELLSASGRSSSDNIKLDGNEALIVMFCRVRLLVLLWSAYYLSSGGRCEAHGVQNSRMFTSSHSQEGTYIKVGHLNYTVVKHNTPEASHCGGEGSGLARASHIWLVAWTVDGLEFSTGCGKAPFQGGRQNMGAIFSDQVHVSFYYYLDHECYFDTGADYRDYSSKTREVHMPWDPGKLVSRSLLKLRLGDKPSFKEEGMLGPSPVYMMVGYCHGLSRARTNGPGPSFGVATYAQQEAPNGASGFGSRNGMAAAAPSLPPRL